MAAHHHDQRPDPPRSDGSGLATRTDSRGDGAHDRFPNSTNPHSPRLGGFVAARCEWGYETNKALGVARVRRPALAPFFEPSLRLSCDPILGFRFGLEPADVLS